MHKLIAISSLLASASAHFMLNYPPARGFDEDKLPTFPCGGQDTVSSNRTQWPLSGGPIQLNMGHTTTNVQVLLALGNSPGDAFNTVLVKTFTIDGVGNFCIADVPLPAGMNVTSGQNATIQVVSNGDDGSGGGLYNCADITFTNATMVQGEMCSNATNVQAVAYSNPNANANTTTVAGESGDKKSDGTRSAMGSWSLMLGGMVAAFATFAL